MIEYKYKKIKGYENKKFTENGHTMFEEDVLQRLKRLSYLEEQIKQYKKMYILSRDGHHIGRRCFKDLNQAKSELLLYRNDATNIAITEDEYGFIKMSFSGKDFGEEVWDVEVLEVV